MDDFTEKPWKYSKHKNPNVHKFDIGYIVKEGDEGAIIATVAQKIYDERSAPGEANANGKLFAAAPDLLQACKCALADLKGMMPEFEVSGDRRHPAWTTIEELRNIIRKVSK